MPHLDVDLYSACLHRSVRMNIIIPDTQKKTDIPTLYLLHGMTDDESCWQRRTSVERYADRYGIAVVMPDAQLSWYCDTPHGEAYFQYVSDELIRATRRMLPVLSHDRSRTYVGGLSMGGYGALKCVLNRPEMFGACICLSGALIPQQLPILVDPETVADFHWEDAFGPLNEVDGSVNDLIAAASAVKEHKAAVYMWCGKQDSLLSMSRTMRECLEKNGFDVLYRETDGAHEWPMWDRELELSMKWLNGEEVPACH